jgi:PAS domain S-box-containing protein
MSKKQKKGKRLVLRSLLILGVALVYFVSAKLGLKLAFVNASATAVWPPTGIGIAALILFDFELWPAIFLGAFFANLTTAGTVITSILIAVGNTLESVAGAYLANKFILGKQSFSTPKNIFRFVLLCGMVATIISPTIGVVSLSFAGFSSWHDFSPVWLTWWLGDMSGALVIAPFLILWFIGGRLKLEKTKIFEALTLIACLGALLWIIFSGIFPFAFLVVPVLVWASFRFGRRGASLLILVLAFTATIGTLNGVGPFVQADTNQSLIFLQFFIIVSMLVALVLASEVEQKELAEIHVSANERRFRALIEKSWDAVSLVDEKVRILYSSPSTKQLMGYEQEELIGQNGLSMVDASDKPKLQNLLANLLTNPAKPGMFQVRARRKDGELFWIEGIASNLLSDPDVRAIVVNYRDITERKKAEQYLRDLVKQLAAEKATDEALLESIGDGIVATNSEGRIILVNPAFENMLGWTRHETLGKFPKDIILMQDQNAHEIPEARRPLSLALATGRKITATHYLIRKDQSRFPALVTATPVRLDKKITGAIKIFHDVSKDIEIDKAKTEFVSMASHQLRTPLTVVKWYVGTLLKEGTNKISREKLKSYLRQIAYTNKDMIDLVNAILNVSRIDLGNLAIEPVPLQLPELLDKTIDEFRVRLRENKLKIEKQYTSLPVMMLDPKLLKVVLENLLTNAIKYTPAGGKVRLAAVQKNNQIVISVSDTGIGIPENVRERIFEKMFRADNAIARDPGGTGLGLYIVKAVLEKVGGRIDVTSKLGQGTTFNVFLPLLGMLAQKGSRGLVQS